MVVKREKLEKTSSETNQERRLRIDRHTILNRDYVYRPHPARLNIESEEYRIQAHMNEAIALQIAWTMQEYQCRSDEAIDHMLATMRAFRNDVNEWEGRTTKQVIRLKRAEMLHKAEKAAETAAINRDRTRLLKTLRKRVAQLEKRAAATRSGPNQGSGATKSSAPPPQRYAAQQPAS